MNDLLDVMPQTREIEINGKTVSFSGLSVKSIGALIARFPEAQMLLDGAMPDKKRWPTLFPELIAAGIASSVGKPGNKEYEAAASNLNLETQVAILDAVIELTFPNGLGAFLARAEKLMSVRGGA